MVNKRFSLHDAYSFGVKSVVNHFTFFFVTVLLGAAISFMVLSFLGFVEYMAFKEHFEAMIHLLNQVMREATGIVKTAGNTLYESIRMHLPDSVAQHLTPREVVAFDISRVDVENFVKMTLPVVIAFKCLVEIIATGWTKIALDLQSNKQVEYDYLYKFYYLVPRVILVELIVMAATMLGAMLFVLPGVFAFQRLRFARYFIIDKNQSIMHALESSWKMTEGSVVHLVGYSIFASFVMAMGRLFFFTMFFVLPLSYQVDANVYRQMTK